MVIVTATGHVIVIVTAIGTGGETAEVVTATHASGYTFATFPSKSDGRT